MSSNPYEPPQTIDRSKSADPKPDYRLARMLRKNLLLASLLLPLITGTVAAIAKFKNPWNGFYDGPLETFVNFATPFPVAMGCMQIICWPLSFGVVIFLTFVKPLKWPVFFIGAIYIAGFVGWGIANNSDRFALYPITNATVILLVVIWTSVKCVRVGKAEQTE